MTTAKPTPGPWVEFSDQGRTIAILPAMRAGEVCSFATPYPSRSNARLIAASPDLLKALKSLVSDVAGSWTAFEVALRQDISNTNYQVVREKLQAAEAVISKAEGRQP